MIINIKDGSAKKVIYSTFGLRFEFHIAQEIRKTYNFDDEIFSISGNVIFANFPAVRKFTMQLNSKREEQNKVTPGEINALGLLDEIFHYIFRQYEENDNPGVFQRALRQLQNKLGDDNLYKLLFDFTSKFPPKDVYKGKVSTLDYLNGYSGSKSNLELALEEMILLYFDNLNPAGTKLKELFDENYLSYSNEYRSAINEIDQFFRKEPVVGFGGKDLFSLIKLPMLSNPNSLIDQLDFIRDNWGIYLSADFMRRILTGKDLSKEDIVFEFTGGGGPPTITPFYKGKGFDTGKFMLGKSMYKYAEDLIDVYDEPEKFTPDINWMPKVVLIAKNTYVWLDQLSKKYKKEIKRLDQIPDEVLNDLARQNFTGLWLIGIWERSTASKRIKHIMGNIDAVASAYSLYDYKIASDLGGEDAYKNLSARAYERGIRLASDMVPNHTGIYSEWVINNPDYFIQSEQPPFPNYSFTGENLSQNPNIEIKIEDGYWERRDAAVVFQHKDLRNGKVRYIYHGNDGTNMPWNDTAQLNMLIPEVREAVIQKIFDVAKKFSIIRFDAAMTLTKKHYARLWFPQPGKGGDIPSRSDYSLTRTEFDKFFPEEFWREVVDRINQYLPDTLLLAEAFWLMEGYFVRSLGMHRVYNSAFMNMLMNEENQKYRQLITNTLEFEPEILKRYVNFMSNPDEETAIHQFGTGDKYFGVATLMVTLPGLPMFGHGQIEGFTEKYGMEYKRAYYNEEPKQWLIDRHYDQIFPLMRLRHLFSQVNNFWFYDFIDEYDTVNENVFAYSNYEGGDRALVFYNNRFERTKGYITISTPKISSSSNNEKIQMNLANALKLNSNNNTFYIFKEFGTKLEYLRSSKDFLNYGFYTSLEGFESKVFLNFREVLDEDGEYNDLAEILGSTGVPSVAYSMQEMKLSTIHEAYLEVLSVEAVKSVIKETILLTKLEEKEELEYIQKNFKILLDEINNKFEIKPGRKRKRCPFCEKFNALRKINSILVDQLNDAPNKRFINLSHSFKLFTNSNYRENILLYFNLLVIFRISAYLKDESDLNRKNYVAKLLLEIPVKKTIDRLGKSQDGIFRELALLNILIEYKSDIFEFFFDQTKKTRSKIDYLSDLINSILNDEYTHQFIGVNFYEGEWYFSKESFEELIDWMLTLYLIDAIEEIDDKFNLKKNRIIKKSTHKTSNNSAAKVKKAETSSTKIDNQIKQIEKEELNKIDDIIYRVMDFRYKLLEMSEQSDYRLNKLNDLLLRHLTRSNGKNNI